MWAKHGNIWVYVLMPGRVVPAPWPSWATDLTPVCAPGWFRVHTAVYLDNARTPPFYLPQDVRGWHAYWHWALPHIFSCLRCVHPASLDHLFYDVTFPTCPFPVRCHYGWLPGADTRRARSTSHTNLGRAWFRMRHPVTFVRTFCALDIAIFTRYSCSPQTTQDGVFTFPGQAGLLHYTFLRNVLGTFLDCHLLPPHHWHLSSRILPFGDLYSLPSPSGSVVRTMVPGFTL